MKAVDVCGNSIVSGSYVLYTGTGTIGRVSDIKTMDNDIWAKVDTTNLWYKINSLQVVDNAKKNLKKESKDDLAKKVKRMKKLVGEDVDMSTELCDGGG